jgi:hypothetical protein
MDQEKKCSDEEVGKWLDENDRPPLPPELWEDDLPEVRQYHGSPRWYEQTSPEEEILTEHPASKRREKIRQYSRDYGWIHDFFAAVFYMVMSWFTTDIMLGILRASYGLVIAALLGAIIYYTYYAQGKPSPRHLPTVEEIMEIKTEEGPL